MHQIPRKLWWHLMQRKGTILHANTRPPLAQPRLKQLNLLGYEVCLVHLIAHFLTKWLHFFKHCNTVFNIKNASTDSSCNECFLKVLWNSKPVLRCDKNKQTYFSLTKKYDFFWKLFLFWSKMMSSPHL